MPLGCATIRTGTPWSPHFRTTSRPRRPSWTGSVRCGGRTRTGTGLRGTSRWAQESWWGPQGVRLADASGMSLGVQGSLFLYLALDRSRSDLALARHSLKRLESGLEV